MNNASIAIDAIYKFASEETKKDIAEAGLGVGALAVSRDKIIGQKTLYHGTHKDKIETIKREGLRAEKGGTGGASSAMGFKHFEDKTKGMVHATGSKSKAKFYAAVNGAGPNQTKAKVDMFEKQNTTPTTYHGRTTHRINHVDDRPFKGDVQEELKRIHDVESKKHMGKVMNQRYNPFAKKEGRVVKIKMDYDKYKKMDVDPDEIGGIIPNKTIGRHMAARGTENITPQEIVGSKSRSAFKSGQALVKKLPEYIKGNKGRFATGVGLAGAGAYMTFDALKKYKNREKSASESIDTLYKFADEQPKREKDDYLADIVCEQCEYEGKPNDDNGRCPRCGAIGGIMPHDPASDKIPDKPPLSIFDDGSADLMNSGIDNDLDMNAY